MVLGLRYYRKAKHKQTKKVINHKATILSLNGTGIKILQKSKKKNKNTTHKVTHLAKVKQCTHYATHARGNGSTMSQLCKQPHQHRINGTAKTLKTPLIVRQPY